ncbi:MAG: sensory transduction histidine kinase [Bacteroidetes bacterium]|nr:MAG: sensory transduction histidine kinase [Bacteroidota bacterium]
MDIRKNSPSRDSKLRQKAEEQLNQQKLETKSRDSDADMLKLVHELEVHQIELEMQNEELILATNKAREVTEKYEELYDLAPIGYFTLSHQGKILELNLCGAQMLGKDRVHLINNQFVFFVKEDSRSVFATFLEEIFQGKSQVNCDLPLLSTNNNRMHVRLTGTLSLNNEQCLAVATDITELKHFEEKNLLALERFKSLVDVSLTGIWATDQFGNNTYASPRWSEITGISADNAIGDGWSFGLHPDDRENVFLDWKQASLHNKPYSSYFRFIRPDGEVVWVLCQANAVRNNDGKIIEWIGIITDITELRLLENAFRENEERLRLALKATNDVVWDWDIVNDKQQWNEAGTKVFGWTEIVENTVDGACWIDRIHPDDRLRVDKGFYAAVKNISGNNWQDEYRFRKADGTYAEVLDRGYILRDDQGNAIRMIGAMMDITERRKVEGELRINRDLLNASERLSKSGGWAYNTDSDTMYWTEETYRIHDITPGEIERGSAVHIKLSSVCYRPEDRQVIMAAFQRCLEKGQPYDFEFPFTSVKGRQKWIRTSAQPVFENDKIISIIGNIVDITESKQAEEALRKSNNRLASAIEAMLDSFLVFAAERNEEGEIIDFIFVEMNANAEKMLQISSNQLIGKRMCEELPINRTNGFFEKYMNVVESGIPLEEEFYLPTTHVPAAWYFHQVVRCNDGIAISHRDITERKQIENNLKENELFAHTIANTTPALLYLYDFEQKKNIWSNELHKHFFEEINTGASGLDFKDIVQLIHPDDLGSGIHFYNELQDTDGVSRFNTELRIKWNDNWKWMRHFVTVFKANEDGKPLQILGALFDIDDQKKTEHNLLVAKEKAEESEDKFRQITESIGEVFWLNNADNSEVIYVSPSYEKVWGHTCQSLYDKPNSFIDAVLEEDKPAVFAEYEKYINGKGFDLEYRIIKPDSSIRWIKAHSFPVKNDAGNVIRHAGIAEDVTQRKLAEIEIEKSKELLSDLNIRLESARENERAVISRDIHDQLGQSLTALKIDLVTLQAKMKTESQEGEAMGGMIKMVNSISRDVQRISSELRPLMLDDLGLSATLEWYCEEFAYRTGLKVELDIEASQSNCINRDLALYRVAQESLTNIIRHANAGVVKVSLCEINNNIVLSIHDNGIGIPPEKLESHKSLGLMGMSERLKQYDGKLEIQSSGNIGTIIKASIPIK